jgi:hypothetical protein
MMLAVAVQAHPGKQATAADSRGRTRPDSGAHVARDCATVQHNITSA